MTRAAAESRRATVLVPTHDHGPLLEYSVRSALAQSMESLEVFIVGDGISEAGRVTAQELVAADPRVQFFDRPKGARHGEAWRHEALAEARGEIVCYLSDDDLWLPDHLATMLELLHDADFAHALPIWLDPDGRVGLWPVDLARPHYRRLIVERENRIPLSCGAHTRSAYTNLAEGWAPAPPELPTDLWMWRKFLGQDWVRSVSGSHPTVLHFPSPDRQGWTLDERRRELETWWRRIDAVDLPSELDRGALVSLRRTHERVERRLAFVEQVLHDERLVHAQGGEHSARAEARVEELESILQSRELEWADALESTLQGREQTWGEERRQLEASLAAAQADLLAREESWTVNRQSLERTLAEARESVAYAEEEASRARAREHRIATTVTWRLREALIGIPGIGRAARWAARALARAVAR